MKSLTEVQLRAEELQSKLEQYKRFFIISVYYSPTIIILIAFNNISLFLLQY